MAGARQYASLSRSRTILWCCTAAGFPMGADLHEHLPDNPQPLIRYDEEVSPWVPQA